jgi:acyl-CoA synthetase (AMP-forming)/AMP-acid ligase II
MYGPTETTIWSTVDRVGSREGLVSIGRPIANTQVYVLDQALEPVPIGVSGELYIGGAGVARGYWKRPELTAERFVPDPFSADPAARLYRTGDLGRHLASGELEVLGRLDHQVKLRGFRIELGEIEAAMSDHADVAKAVVALRGDDPAEQRLVAYYVPRGEPAPEAEELRALLKERLPDYMMPSTIMTLDAVPLTPNGKVDREALPERGRLSIVCMERAARYCSIEGSPSSWAMINPCSGFRPMVSTGSVRRILPLRRWRLATSMRFAGIKPTGPITWQDTVSAAWSLLKWPGSFKRRV